MIDSIEHHFLDCPKLPGIVQYVVSNSFHFNGVICDYNDPRAFMGMLPLFSIEAIVIMKVVWVITYLAGRHVTPVSVWVFHWVSSRVQEVQCCGLCKLNTPNRKKALLQWKEWEDRLTFLTASRACWFSSSWERRLQTSASLDSFSALCT